MSKNTKIQGKCFIHKNNDSEGETFTVNSHRYIFRHTASHTCSKHAGSSYDVTHVTSIRGVRDIITSSGFIRFVNKEYKIQIIRAVHHHLW